MRDFLELIGFIFIFILFVGLITFGGVYLSSYSSEKKCASLRSQNIETYIVDKGLGFKSCYVPSNVNLKPRE
jgi:hypothetical protein